LTEATAVAPTPSGGEEEGDDEDVGEGSDIRPCWYSMDGALGRRTLTTMSYLSTTITVMKNEENEEKRSIFF